MSPPPELYGDATRMKALTDSMHAFNSFVVSDSRLQPVMLPLRDGLTLIRYRDDDDDGKSSSSNSSQ